ncbi:MAG: tetratricopeptide repeat protein [Casimicrobium sp.]
MNTFYTTKTATTSGLSLALTLLASLLMGGCATPPSVDITAAQPTPSTSLPSSAACYQPSCCDEASDATALKFEPHRLNCRAIALTAAGKNNESFIALQAAIALAKAENVQTAAATEVLCFTLNDAAHRANDRGDDAGSQALFAGNLAACSTRFGESSDTAAQALYGGASQHLKHERYSVALPQLQRVIAITRSNGNRGLESFATDAMGRLKDQSGDHAEGQRLLREAIAIKTAVFGAKSKEVAVSFTNLGASYVDTNDGATGREWYRRAFALYAETLGAADVSTLDVGSALATSYLFDGELKQAEKLYETLLPRFTETYGGTDEHTVAIVNDWGAALARQQRYGEAFVKFEQAVAIRRVTVPNSIRYGYSALNAAKMKKVTANCAAAEPLRSEARRVANTHMKAATRDDVDVVQFVKDTLNFEQECASGSAKAALRKKKK